MKVDKSKKGVNATSPPPRGLCKVQDLKEHDPQMTQMKELNQESGFFASGPICGHLRIKGFQDFTSRRCAVA